jgi:hypothetical protein
MITKSKSRRLLLLNDLVVCVSVAPKATDDFGNSERLSLKWTYPVTDIEVIYVFKTVIVARGSIVVKAQCSMPEGRGFNSR